MSPTSPRRQAGGARDRSPCHRHLRLAVATIAALLLLPTAAAFTPTLFFDLVLAHMSPLLQFNEENYSTPQWRIEYVDGTPLSAGEFIEGATQHRVGPVRADLITGLHTLKFNLIGRGCRIEGSLNSSSTYALYFNPRGPFAVGESLGAPPGPILADTSINPLNFTKNTVELEPNGDDTVLTVANATIYTGMVTEATELVNVPTYFVPFVTDDNQRNPFFQYSGEWTVETEIGPAGKTVSHRSLIGSVGAKLRVPVPAGTTFLIVNGTAGPEYACVDPEWEGGIVPVIGMLGPYSAAVCNATSSIVATNQPMYYVELDRTQGNYSMLLSAPTNGHKGIALDSVTFYSARADGQGTVFSRKEPSDFPGRREDMVMYVPGTSSDSGTGSGASTTGRSTSTAVPSSSARSSSRKPPNLSAIVGGAIGGCAALALICFLILFLLKRRRKRTRTREEPPKLFEVDVDSPQTDDDINARVTPFTPVEPHSPHSPHSPHVAPFDIKAHTRAVEGRRHEYTGYRSELFRGASHDEQPAEGPSEMRGQGPAVITSPAATEKTQPLPSPPAPRSPSPVYSEPPVQERDAGRLVPPAYNPEWRDQ